jgi:hypothetical protein
MCFEEKDKEKSRRKERLLTTLFLACFRVNH